MRAISARTSRSTRRTSSRVGVGLARPAPRAGRGSRSAACAARATRRRRTRAGEAKASSSRSSMWSKASAEHPDLVAASAGSCMRGCRSPASTRAATRPSGAAAARRAPPTRYAAEQRQTATPSARDEERLGDLRCARLTGAQRLAGADRGHRPRPSRRTRSRYIRTSPGSRRDARVPRRAARSRAAPSAFSRVELLHVVSPAAGRPRHTNSSGCWTVACHGTPRDRYDAVPVNASATASRVRVALARCTGDSGSNAGLREPSERPQASLRSGLRTRSGAAVDHQKVTARTQQQHAGTQATSRQRRLDRRIRAAPRACSRGRARSDRDRGPSVRSLRRR